MSHPETRQLCFHFISEKKGNMYVSQNVERQYTKAVNQNKTSSICLKFSGKKKDVKSDFLACSQEPTASVLGINQIWQ